MGSSIPFLIANGSVLSTRFWKKSSFIIVENENKELVQTRLLTKIRVCIDYRKLNVVTSKDHFSLPFIDQMLERLVGREYYCFLDGYSGYNQIPIAPKDQEKTMFTCPFGTFWMPFSLCNAPTMFQCCMLSLFSDMVEWFLEIHGWFLHLWRLIRSMSSPSRTCPPTLC